MRRPQPHRRRLGHQLMVENLQNLRLRPRTKIVVEVLKDEEGEDSGRKRKEERNKSETIMKQKRKKSERKKERERTKGGKKKERKKERKRKERNPFSRRAQIR